MSPPGPAGGANPDTPLERFRRSMVIDYEKWHDGIGYDLDALRAASPAERAAIESLLLGHGVADWRDVEALAALDTPQARAALQAAKKSSDSRVRAAVLDYAPGLLTDAERTAALVRLLETAEFFDGLTQALDQVEEFHPPEVVDALFRGALHRKGEVAVHFAAMLTFLHGKAGEAFDWEQRPFFLRFNTPDRAGRETVFRELCARIGADAGRYLRNSSLA